MVQNGRLTMGTNYIAPTWRMPENTNKDKLSNYSLVGSTNGKINIATPATVGIASSFSFWFKRTNILNDSQPYGIGPSYGMYMFDTNGVYMRYGGAHSGLLGSTALQTALALTDWVHWVITRKETSATHQDIKIYANGQLVQTQNTSTFGTSNSEVNSIMHALDADDDFISQFVIFDYAIDIDQVTYLYNLNNPMVISGGEPIAYYPLGDNSNPIANAGYPNISVGADSVFNFAPDSFINCGDINSVNSDGESAFSISCWFKSTSTSGGSLVTKSKNSANFDGYQLWLDATGEVRFYLGSYTGTANTSPWVYVKSANQFNNGEWHNAVVTYNANQSTSGIKLYIDNVEQVLSVYNNAPSVSSSVQNDFMIGARGNSSANGFYYTGEISNVQFWDAKLEASEVETLYNNGQPLMTGTQPQASNLKAWYKLNQYDSYWDLGGNGKWTFNNAAIN